MKKRESSWDFFQGKILEHLCRFVLLGVVSLSFLEVIRRYLFGSSFLWAEEAQVYLNLMAVCLYFGLAERQKAHIRLDIVVLMIKKKWKRAGEIIELAGTLVSLCFCCLFVWFGIDFVKAGIDFGRQTENAEMPLWPFYVILLVGFAFFGVEATRSIFLQIRGLRGGKN